MILAMLECGDRLRVEEDDQAETSEFCPGCGFFVEVLGYEEVPGE